MDEWVIDWMEVKSYVLWIDIVIIATRRRMNACAKLTFKLSCFVAMMCCNGLFKSLLLSNLEKTKFFHNFKAFWINPQKYYAQECFARRYWESCTNKFSKTLLDHYQFARNLIWIIATFEGAPRRCIIKTFAETTQSQRYNLQRHQRSTVINEWSPKRRKIKGINCVYKRNEEKIKTLKTYWTVQENLSAS